MHFSVRKHANQHMDSFRKLPCVAPISNQRAHLQQAHDEADAIVFCSRVSVANLRMRLSCVRQGGATKLTKVDRCVVRTHA